MEENKKPYTDQSVEQGEKERTTSTNSIAQNGVIVKCNIDSRALKCKPAQHEVGGVINSTKKQDRVISISLERLAKAVTMGYTFTQAEMLGTKAKDWNSQQLFVADIDNDKDGQPELKVDEALEIAHERGLYPAFVYHTFTSGVVCDKNPKGYSRYRLVFVTDEAVTDSVEAVKISKGIISLFPQCDPNTYTLERILYGTDKGLIGEGQNATFNKVIALNIYAERVEEQPRQLVEIPSSTTTQPTAPIVSDFDLNTACSDFDMLGYVLSQHTARKTYNKGNGVCVNPCPLCGHQDNFIVTGGLWVCKGTDKGGNIINYLMETKGLDKAGAVKYFKYDILGRDEKADKKAYALSFPEKTRYNEGLQARQKVDNYDTDWIRPEYNAKGEFKGYTVLPSILAEHLRNTTSYLFVRDSAKQGVQRFYYMATLGYYKHISDDEIKGLIKQLIPLDLQQMADINECMNLLYTDLKYYNMEDINANENIINFQNGTLELDTMTLREHSPKDLCTIQIACNYDPEAVPVNGSFDYFIDFFTGGNKSVQSYLLQYMGAIISNVKGWRMKKALFMVGKTDAGKSQLKSLTERLIGKANITSMELDELEARFGASNLFNKRLAGSDDMSYMTVKELNTFKKVTGGGSVFTEYKGENGFDFSYNGLLWFCCNRLPKFGGDKGDAVFNRITVVECNHVATKLDKHLQDKMFAERDYIVSKCIRALQAVIKNGYDFIIPKACTDAVAEYKTEVNSFLRFMEDCTVERQSRTIQDSCTCKRLYDVYVAWCNDNNAGYAESKRDIKPLLVEIGKGEIKLRDGRECYSQFTLSLNTKYEYQRAYGWDTTMSSSGQHDNSSTIPPQPQPIFEDATDQITQETIDSIFG